MNGMLKNISFMRYRKIAFVMSLLLFLLGIGGIGGGWLKLGIDFEGGTMIEISSKQVIDLPQLRAALTQAGFDATVTLYGNENTVAARLRNKTPISDQSDSSNKADSSNKGEGHIKPGQDQVTRFMTTVRQIYGDAVLRRVDMVGPKIGSEIWYRSLWAFVVAFMAIFAYVWCRFKWQFSLGAIVTLIHDVVVVMCLLMLMGISFELPVVAGVLTTVGYSVNDTIVIYDRIREILNNDKNDKNDKKHEMVAMFDSALRSTFSRTMITSLTTGGAVLIIMLMGGVSLYNFALTVFLGILIGTYSSIFVASSLLLYMPGVREMHLGDVQLDKLNERPRSKSRPSSMTVS